MSSRRFPAAVVAVLAAFATWFAGGSDAFAYWKIDRSFGKNGTENFWMPPADLSKDRAGRVLVTGSVGGPYYSLVEARLLRSGKDDLSFGYEGSIALGPGNQNAYGLASDVDRKGRIVVAGRGANAWDIRVGPELRRLTPDGKRDKSFRQTVAFPKFASYYYTDVENLPNGKILVAGADSRDSRIVIRRANSDGSYDRSFGNRGFVRINGRKRVEYAHLTGATNIHLLRRGKFLVSGSRDGRAWVGRFLESGDLDRSFGGNGMITAPMVDRTNCGPVDVCAPQGLAVTESGHIRVIANQSYGTELKSRAFVVGFNPDGSIDRSFGRRGKALVMPTTFTHGAGFLMQLPDGSMIIAPSLDTRTPKFGRVSKSGKQAKVFGSLSYKASWISSGVVLNKESFIVGDSLNGNIRKYTAESAGSK